MPDAYQCQNCGRPISQLGVWDLHRWVHNHSQSERCDAPSVAVPEPVDQEGRRDEVCAKCGDAIYDNGGLWFGRGASVTMCAGTDGLNNGPHRPVDQEGQ